ncbi:MAG: prepilin-type N-terminal cleavage/methylation domain-containing protein [Elusimicrobiaceae bacterium]|nr:prepilin-type N-terminal cleavage/methylation domain-containing protein [Elusimicrobiaceae bacterium]
MKEKGFTLIELLVVVLIIGILAAVALPQYQKSVEKSRTAQALTLINALVQAQDRYKMSNGVYAESFSVLDIDLPGSYTGNTPWLNAPSAVKDTRSGPEWTLQLATAASDPGSLAIMMGRTTGKYKGTGFIYWLNASNPQTNRRLLCGERKASGIIFSGATGSYCQKVLNGRSLEDSDSLPLYTLP